jgi:hypothetical protein
MANKPQFFGTANAETVSNAIGEGSWSGDDAYAFHSSSPWVRRGGQAAGQTVAGTFSFDRSTGAVSSGLSHRTILSGY